MDDIQVQAKIDVKSNTSGVDEAKSSLSSFGESLRNVGEIAAALGLERVAEKIVELGKTAAEFAVETAANFEQTATSMGTLLGSTKEAGTLLQQLSDWEVHTPFTFEQITNGAKQLVAAGEKAKDIPKTMQQLADISMGDPARLQELVSVWGEVNSLQEVNGRTILRLSSISVPIYQYIAQAAKEMGLITGKGADASVEGLKKMISAGKITPEVFNRALQDMTEKGGKFYQETQRQAETFNGVLSSTKSQFQRIALEIMGVSLTGDIDKNGLFAKLKDSLQIFFQYLSQHKEEIATAIKNIAEAVVNFGIWIATKVIPALITMYDWVTKHKEILAVLAGIVAGAVVVALIAFLGAIVGIIAALATFFTSVVGVVALLVGVGVGAFVLIKMHVQDLAKFFVDLGNTVMNVINGIIGFLANMANAVIDSINTVIGAIDKVSGAKIGSLGHISLGSPAPAFSSGGGLGGAASFSSATIDNGITINNHNNFNSSADIASFSHMVGWQVSNNR